jgi:hypothetical protein
MIEIIIVGLVGLAGLSTRLGWRLLTIKAPERRALLDRAEHRRIDREFQDRLRGKR